MTTLVQLFSARDHLPWEAVLDQIAAQGFDGVEGFFGVFDDPTTFRAALQARGLTMPQAHVPLELLEQDFDGAVEMAETLGIFTLIGPWLPPEDRPTDTAGWHELGGRLNEIEGRLRRLGRRFAWHNHDFELLPLADGSNGMDILLESAPGMDWEADLGWVLRAGQSPSEWLTRHQGRIVAVHLKDLQPNPDTAPEGGWADLGHGTNDWSPIFAQLKSLPRLSAYVAEHDMPADLGRFLSRWKSSYDRLARYGTGSLGETGARIAGSQTGHFAYQRPSTDVLDDWIGSAGGLCLQKKVDMMRPTSSRRLHDGQISQLVVASRDGSRLAVIYETGELIEAPNWTPDGKWLVYNGDGRLFRISPDGREGPIRINTAPIEDLNNDHVISPDGKWLYISANDGHLYRVAIEGGTPVRVSNEQEPARGFRYYLHGISPDGTTLAYVGLELEKGRVVTRICTIPSAGGADTVLTDGACPVDGPEYSPDGAWIYFNSEAAATVPGHAQVFRMRPDGSGVEQQTHDEKVNWFPHPSPDGSIVAYIAFPAGTVGHPADKDVIIRTMDPQGGNIVDIDRFNGGQGSINVASWSPDSKAFAYVRYPASKVM